MILKKILKSNLFTHFLIKNFNVKKSIEQQAYYQHRKQSLKQHMYNHFSPTMNIAKFIEKYSENKKIENNQRSVEFKQRKQHSSIAQKLAGRVSAIRVHGKTTFIDVRQEHHKVQLVLDKEVNAQQIRRGDIVGVEGQIFFTKKGQLSLKVAKLQLLSPCLWMLPQYEALKDAQVRYRQRHLDLITNSAPLHKLVARAKVISCLRKYLQRQDFLEVQTPILSNSAGGALAKPFKTYHNDYKMDIFMRIAPQLYLKKLLVGGFTKVYEIGKNFRNQSVDQTHNPQFTSCQLYWAYSDYTKLQQFTQDLICKLSEEVNGSCKLITHNNQEIDLSLPWVEVSFIQTLEQKLKVHFPIDFDSPQALQFVDGVCRQHRVDCDEPRTIQRLLDKLGEQFLQPINYPKPLFIKDHPKVLSPLAKPIPGKPHLTQRFELFINGWELVNSYTQLNDPSIQKDNTPNDQEYVEALEFGLMPCAGWGIGIDRLVMLLTQSDRIQQVIAYPLLRNKDN